MNLVENLTIQQLADDLARVETCLVAYREMVQVGLKQLAEANQHEAKLRKQLSSLREEIRRYTAGEVV